MENYIQIKIWYRQDAVNVRGVLTAVVGWETRFFWIQWIFTG